MTDRSPRRIDPANTIIDIDTTVPNAARVYDYLLGGTNNFAVDREAAERNNAGRPGAIDAPRAAVQAAIDDLGYAPHPAARHPPHRHRHGHRPPYRHRAGPGRRVHRARPLDGRP